MSLIRLPIHARFYILSRLVPRSFPVHLDALKTAIAKPALMKSAVMNCMPIDKVLLIRRLQIARGSGLTTAEPLCCLLPGISSASVPSMTLSPVLVFLSRSPFALTASDATTGVPGFPSSPAHHRAMLRASSAWIDS